MAYGSSSGGSAEPAIGEQGYILVQAHAGDCTGRAEHLTHAGSSLGTFIADDDDIAGLDPPAENRLDALFLAVEHTGGALVHQHLLIHGAALDHGPVGCQVSSQNGNASHGGERLLDRTNHLVVIHVCLFIQLTDALAADGGKRGIEQTGLAKLMHYGKHTSGCIEILDVMFACRGEMAEIRNLGADIIGHEDIQVHTRLMGDGWKVKHRVGAAPEGHIYRQGIGKRLFCHNIKRTNIVLQQFHDLIPRLLGQPVTGAVYSGDRPIAGKPHSDGLGQAVHAVCGKHTAARTTGGACIVLIGEQLFITEQACCMGAYLLEHHRKTGAAAAIAGNFSGEHRTAGDKDRGNVDPGCSHQHTGYDLVTVGNEHQSIERMGGCHDLDGVGDDLAACKRVLHACMPHRYAVTDTDDRERDGVPPCLTHPCLDRLHNPVEMNVAGNDVIRPVYDADDRHMDFPVGPSQGLHQRPVGASLGSLGHLC
ncbi:hypothetical protein SDC9_78520 [bioreactor metagenome]|uniref:Uncharacterized protein n=1 Tax=bioreactor metagenome TaxID=1076179 RepID=A0A644YZQ1_9ZZZZ